MAPILVDAVAPAHVPRVNRRVQYDISPDGGTSLLSADRASTKSASVSQEVEEETAANGTDSWEDPCECKDHLKASFCQESYSSAFNDAFLEGSKCITKGSPNNRTWCYTSLECMHAPGLGLSSEKKCKYRDADVDGCKVPENMCECLPVEHSKACHPEFADKFHQAYLNGSLCIEDEPSKARALQAANSWCYTSMNCKAAAVSSQGKCRYMYVAGTAMTCDIAVGDRQGQGQWTDGGDDAESGRQFNRGPSTPHPTFRNGDDTASKQQRASEEENVQMDIKYLSDWGKKKNEAMQGFSLAWWSALCVAIASLINV